jgi:hypothetical protein
MPQQGTENQLIALLKRGTTTLSTMTLKHNDIQHNDTRQMRLTCDTQHK